MPSRASSLQAGQPKRKAGTSIAARAWIIAFNSAVWGTIFYVGTGAYQRDQIEQAATITIKADPDMPLLNISARIKDADLRQIHCLAKTIYFEARGESLAGKKAIADVIYNRLASGLYPDSICQIVYQGPIGPDGLPVRDRCQFSWYCDGIEHKINDHAKWAESVSLAYNQYLYHMKSEVGNATAYHNQTVNPTRGIWRNARKIIQIGNHSFFEPQGKFTATKRSTMQ